MRSAKKSASIAGVTVIIFDKGARKKILKVLTEIYGLLYYQQYE